MCRKGKERDGNLEATLLNETFFDLFIGTK